MAQYKVQRSEKRTSCIKKIKAQPCWKPFIKFVRFVVHFMTVMLLLGFGAFAFTIIEDPVPEDHENQPSNITNKSSSTTWENSEIFFNYLHEHYNITIASEERRTFLKDIRKHGRLIRDVVTEDAFKDRINDRMYIFKKWFYFVTVATTTIGYGDIYPVTEMGKIFYTAFSIIGIPLMMTLLALCGDIMTLINTKIFGLINRCLCKKKRLISEELLSSFTLFLFFSGYLSIGCMYVYYELEWGVVDSIYFWVVTFTTVGFGDIYIALDEQEDWLIGFLILYRLFGLALLAGLIDSLVSWINKRKETLEETAKLLKNQALLSGETIFAKDQEGAKEPDESVEFIEDVDLSKLSPKKITYC